MDKEKVLQTLEKDSAKYITKLREEFPEDNQVKMGLALLYYGALMIYTIHPANSAREAGTLAYTLMETVLLKEQKANASISNPEKGSDTSGNNPENKETPGTEQA